MHQQTSVRFTNPQPWKGVILQKTLYRLCPLILVFFVLLLSFFPVTKVNATNFDYLDYIVTDSYSDGQNHLKIQIPISEFTLPLWELRYAEDGTFLQSETGVSFVWDEPGERALDLTFNAFNGSSEKGQDFVLIRDIPDESVLTLYYRIDDVYDYGYITMSVQWTLHYYDINYNYIGMQQSPKEYGDVTANAVDVTLEKPKNAVWMQAIINWNPLRGLSSTDYHFVAEAFEFDVTIDSLQREQQISGQTNKLLEKVNDSLNATVPGADDSINDSNDAQDRLEEAGDALSNVPKPPASDVNVSINNYLPSDSVAQSNNFFSYLWESELFMTMIILTFTMGTCSYILFGKR